MGTGFGNWGGGKEVGLIKIIDLTLGDETGAQNTKLQVGLPYVYV